MPVFHSYILIKLKGIGRVKILMLLRDKSISFQIDRFLFVNFLFSILTLLNTVFPFNEVNFLAQHRGILVTIRTKKLHVMIVAFLLGYLWIIRGHTRHFLQSVNMFNILVYGGHRRLMILLLMMLVVFAHCFAVLFFGKTVIKRFRFIENGL
ncbi:hypothetical protein CDL12_00885 [Handroanthus impetiginosus]|uniref:Uncharacterized protein n=1 Tax=Handroanthus impetiginosus TaxID=429701 RepID=A0A2G9I9D8_9LAMI|nr:hypothetical protein CDL12_00885 [Handroanthus impetiginosus]